MAELLAQREVRLAGNERIVFDHTVGHYRAARYYRMREADGKMRDVRATATAQKLLDMLCALFNRQYPDPRVHEVERYIRSTDWGARLP